MTRPEPTDRDGDASDNCEATNREDYLESHGISRGTVGTLTSRFNNVSIERNTRTNGSVSGTNSNTRQAPPPRYSKVIAEPQENIYQSAEQGPSVMRPIPPEIKYGLNQNNPNKFGQRSYSASSREIEYSKIGNGNKPHTENVEVCEFKSHIPEYDLVYTENQHQNIEGNPHDEPWTNEGVVDVEGLLGSRNLSKYRRNINREDMEILMRGPDSPGEYNIRIFDTPGLEDSNGNDVKNTAKILESLSMTQKIDLVIITISNGVPLTPGVRRALEDYRNIFKEMRGLIAFVHTKVDYRKLHPDSHGYSGFTSRKRDLNHIMGQEARHFAINSDFEEERPVLNYKRLTDIRELLSLAEMNVPVSTDQMRLSKTKWMRDVDNVVIMTCLKDERFIQQQIFNNNLARSNAAEKEAEELKLALENTRSEYIEKRSDLYRLDTDTLEFLDEKTSHASWKFSDFAPFTIAPIIFQASDLPCAIDAINEGKHGYQVELLDGGHGYNHWKIKITREAFKRGHYNAKLYAKRRNRFKSTVDALREEVKALEITKLNLERRLAVCGAPVKSKNAEEERRLLKVLATIRYAKRETLDSDIFKAAAEAGVYQGSPEECTANVIEFCADYDF
ncbi:hypothetical protein BGW38_004540 [Lunasporangiospora selenospora]|uniref:Dynamin family protein n=1 Tax=Lunasporangiospora selenospora TaxID=979761 RepID=A0A9P6KIS2_9FUNG|nr:hypothetical protein BGW38_004540 [Lunasporangiospora selenospora]